MLPQSQHRIPSPMTTLHLPEDFHHSWDNGASDVSLSTTNAPVPELLTPVQPLPPPPALLPPPTPQPHITTRLERTIREPLRFADTSHLSLLACTATFTPSV